MEGQTYVCTDVHDITAIKPNFLTSMGYHIFLAMVLGVRRALLILNPAVSEPRWTINFSSVVIQSFVC